MSDENQTEQPGAGLRGVGRPPPRIPDHTLVRCIGEGSYGRVWLAQNALKEWRAVKIVCRKSLWDDEPLYQREFNGIRCYEPVSRSHDSLVQVLHVGVDEADQTFYYVMELADDASLEGAAPGEPAKRAQQGSPDQASTPRPPDRIRLDPAVPATLAAYAPRTLRHELHRRKRLPPDECVELGIGLATALGELHRNGLVHRDIKPSNIIFIRGRPKLADIGLVTDMDATRSFVGTQGYVAPEGPGGRAADIYALGKVLYEAATGRDRSDSPALPDLASLESVEREALHELNAVILKACETDPARRHRSADELLAELLRLRSGESVVHRRFMERTLRVLRLRYRGALAAIAIGALAVGLWAYRSRLNEVALLAELRAQRQLRMTGRRSGWFQTDWDILQRAARGGATPEILAQATTILAGVDATELAVHRDRVGGSAAFGLEGNVVVGGDTESLAGLIDRAGNWQELATKGEGPVAWSAEGEPLQLTANESGSVVREVRSGRVRATFDFGAGQGTGPRERPTLAMTGDGQYIAAAVPGDHSRILAWRVCPSALVGEVAESASVLSFSPDGERLAAGDENGRITVYEMPSLKEQQAVVLMPSRALRVSALALAEDRSVPLDSRAPVRSWLVVAAYGGGDIVIWETRTRQPRAFCRGSPWSATALAFSPDGTLLASAGRNEFRLWDVGTGNLLLRADDTGSTGHAGALAFSPDGSRLLWGTVPGFAPPTVSLWSLDLNRGIRALRGLSAPVRRVWFSPTGRSVAALADNWRLAVWGTPDGRLQRVFEVPPGGLADNAGAALDAADERLAFASRTEARLYEIGSGRLRASWRLPVGWASEMLFDQAGGLLLARIEFAGTSKEVGGWRVYQLGESSGVRLLQAQSEPDWDARDVVFGGQGTSLVVCGFGETSRHEFRAYNIATGAGMWATNTQRDGHAQPGLFADPLGQKVVCRTEDNDLSRLIDSLSGADTGHVPKHCGAVGPLPGQFAARENVTGMTDGWAVTSLEGVLREVPLANDWETCFEPKFDPDGRLFVWGTLEGTVLVADLTEVQRRVASLGGPR